MLPPPKPANESERLRALTRYNVLDTDAEEDYDEITASVAKICGTAIAIVSLLDAIAIVSLLDENRQWFKSRYGLEATETSRDISFCGHAILEPERVMIVADATRDERFVDNPLVIGAPNIRFYAGTPLVTHDGCALGTLCVIDTVPRTMTAEQIATLRLAGQTVLRLLEQRHTIELLETAVTHQRAVEAELRTQIDERRRIEEHLRFVSAHDSLTSLPNRAQFLSRLQVTLDRLKTSVGSPFAVCFIDLDYFKQFNDTLGHVCGDELLIEVARRLTQMKRVGDSAARLGGDEFAMVIENITAVQLPAIVARIADGIREPLLFGDEPTHVGASIGVVFVDKQYASVKDIVRDADIAMYASKEHGRNRYTVFTTDLRDQFTLANETKLTLRRALDQHQFRLGYQPIVPLVRPRKRPVGFEALLRWEQHDGTYITAAQFIDTAEQTGMIVELGYWVLREACAQARRWQETGGDPIVTAVNVSAKQLAEPGFSRAVKRIVREAKVDPRLLAIEVTESILIDDVDASLDIMNELRAFGIKIYLDDFGTGYSSLSYLRKFPVDRIKIDRSFVSGIDEGLADPLIVHSIISLAHKLEVEVIAEGVETQRQRDALADLGCDYAQGFLFSRAVPAPEASLLLLICAQSIG